MVTLKAMVGKLGPSTKKLNMMREEARECQDVTRLRAMVEELADAVWMSSRPTAPPRPRSAPPIAELILDESGNGHVAGYRVITAK